MIRAAAMLARRPWRISVGFNGADGLLHVVALRYGPLSLVQRLGVALPLGAGSAGRRVTAADWRGAGLTVLGLAVPAPAHRAGRPIADPDRAIGAPAGRGRPRRGTKCPTAGRA